METKHWRGGNLLLNGDEWHTGERITWLSRRESLGPWVHQYHPHQPHWGLPSMHPCDIIVVSELRLQPLLSYKVCILCLGTVTLPWRFDFLDSPWTCLSISDSSGNLIWSALLGWDGAPACLSVSFESQLAPVVETPLASW